MKKWIFIILAVLIIGGGAAGYFYYKNSANKSESAQNSTSKDSSTSQPTGSKNVATVIKDSKNLSTFTSSLKAASLTEGLQGTGPFTVLAPTDEAFKALPAGALDRWLKLENLEQLKNVLNYQIIPGTLNANQFTNGQKIKTANGQEIIVELADGQITFVDAKGGKATIVKSNLGASNGVVHTINAVLLPQ